MKFYTNNINCNYSHIVDNVTTLGVITALYISDILNKSKDSFDVIVKPKNRFVFNFSSDAFVSKEVYVDGNYDFFYCKRTGEYGDFKKFLELNFGYSKDIVKLISYIIEGKIPFFLYEDEKEAAVIRSILSYHDNCDILATSSSDIYEETCKILKTLESLLVKNKRGPIEVDEVLDYLRVDDDIVCETMNDLSNIPSPYTYIDFDEEYIINNTETWLEESSDNKVIFVKKEVLDLEYSYLKECVKNLESSDVINIFRFHVLNKMIVSNSYNLNNYGYSTFLLKDIRFVFKEKCEHVKLSSYYPKIKLKTFVSDELIDSQNNLVKPYENYIKQLKKLN